MFHIKRLAVGAAMMALLTLTACNLGKAPEPTPDVNALYTQAADTLVAQYNEQQTQTARAATPTTQASPTALASPSPFPTFALSGLTPFSTLAPGLTALPTIAGGGAVSFPVGCDDAKFIGETIPDKTKIDAQKDFKKAWSMLNVGTCTWDEGYTFAFKSGERLSGTDIKITKEADFTKPGGSQAFVVTLKAPNKVGEFIGFWQMRNDAGTWFGSLVSVDIVVD
jgi:hypothetical protein